jgi:quinate dehydrogenase
MLPSTCKTPSQTNGSSDLDRRKYTYLAGVGVTHSIAPPMHDYIAQSLGYEWQFIAKECPAVQDVMTLFRDPTFAGGVVTMPYKKTIMPYLDGLDELAVKLGACNNVYRAADGTLRGTNTDWRGVKGCLVTASEEGRGKPAMIIGAGGASRAAVYALNAELGCDTIYIINRDKQEVLDLLSDAKAYTNTLKLVHVESVARAQELSSPYYIVGTVPDFEPQTTTEKVARNILETFLRNAEVKGVLLDMCFKPRRTRILKLGVKHGWKDVDGTGIIGHQVEEQYRLWCGEEASKNVPMEGAWRTLQRAAEESTGINF